MATEQAGRLYKHPGAFNAQVTEWSSGAIRFLSGQKLHQNYVFFTKIEQNEKISLETWEISH